MALLLEQFSRPLFEVCSNPRRTFSCIFPYFSLVSTPIFLGDIFLFCLMTDKCSHFLLFTIMAYHFTCLSCGVISILLLAYQQNLHCFKNSLKLELSHTPFYIKSVLLRKVWELVMVYCSPQGKSLSHCSGANDRDSSPLSLE